MVIDSVPPATIACADPARIRSAAMAIACNPEEQNRLMVIAEVSIGSPARNAAIRATFIPCSPSGIAQPRITSSISLASRPGTRASASLIASAAKSSGRVARNEPLNAFPTGVRTEETITASGMAASQSEFPSYCWASRQEKQIHERFGPVCRTSGKGAGTRSGNWIHREIFARQLRAFFCKIERSAKVSSEKPHFAVQVALQDTFAVLVRKLAMHVNRGFACDSSHIPGHPATLLEPPHRAVKHDEVGDTVGMVVAFAVHVLESALFLELLDQILVKRNLEFRGQLDLLRLNHEHLSRRGLFYRRRQRLRANFRRLDKPTQKQNGNGRGVENTPHRCFSFAATDFASAPPESSCIGTLVWAPCATSSFLNTSAWPACMVKIAPCNAPSPSRYWIVSVSSFERNKLKNRPPPYGANMVSVPNVPRSTRWLSFPLTTSSTEWIGTLAFVFEFENCRFPFSCVRIPLVWVFTPARPVICTTLVPTSGCCATLGNAVEPRMPARKIMALRIARWTIAASLTTVHP